MALEVFFWLNVEEAALKFARPMFVSSPGLCALPRLLRFGREFQGSGKSLGHMLDFILSVTLQSGPEFENINENRHIGISAFAYADVQDIFYTPSM